MKREKAHTSSTDNCRVPHHVGLLISISRILAIDGRE